MNEREIEPLASFCRLHEKRVLQLRELEAGLAHHRETREHVDAIERETRRLGAFVQLWARATPLPS